MCGHSKLQYVLVLQSYLICYHSLLSPIFFVLKILTPSFVDTYHMAYIFFKLFPQIYTNLNSHIYIYIYIYISLSFSELQGVCAANGVLHLLPPDASKSDILDFLEGKIYGDDAVDAGTALILKEEIAGKNRIKGGGGGGGGEVCDLISSSEDESDGGD
jgi:hypothetical protein